MARPDRCRRACAVGAALLLLAGCVSREERLASHVARGEAYAADGRLAEAVLEYQSALALEPSDAELHQRIGDLLVRQRVTDDAVAFYRQAFQLDPTRIEAAMSEARLLAFGDPARARELVQLGLERAPELASVHRTRAHVALAGNRLEEAELAARRAVELDATSSANWAELGRVHQGRIRRHQLDGSSAPPEVFQAALEAFANVDRLEGGDLRARLERVRVLAAWPGHLAEALLELRSVLASAKQQGDVEDRLFAARLLEEIGRRERDAALLREGLRETVEADASTYAAWEELARLSDEQSPPSGEEVCRELIARRPQDPRSHQLLADYLMRAGRSADAIAHLRGVTASDAASPALFELLLSIHLRAGQLEEARATLTAMADAFPDDPLAKIAEARLAIAEDRLGDAVAVLKALGDAGPAADVQYLLALAEYRRGAPWDAVAPSERAVALSPSSVEAHRLDARIRHDVRHFGRVVHTYRLLRGLGYRLTPSDELRLGRALYEAGSPEGGRAVLERLLAQPEPQPAAVIEFVRREGKQRFEVAHAALVAALARVPGDPDLLEALVDLERAAGRSADSLARLDAEIAAGRARPRVLLLRARVLTAQGELARAEADVLRAFEAAPLLPGAVELLFDIYRRQDRLDEARRSFEAAETAGVLHAGARMLLGRLYRSQGDLARAQQAYEGVVAELPQLGAAKSGLALVLAERGEQLDRAIELAHEAKRQAPLWDPAAMDALAYVYYRAGRLKEALDEQGRAILSAKTASGVVAPLYSYHLGLVLQAMGRASEAASAFERALDGGEDFPEAADARRRLEAEVATPAPDAKAS